MLDSNKSTIFLKKKKSQFKVFVYIWYDIFDTYDTVQLTSICDMPTYHRILTTMMLGSQNILSTRVVIVK